MPSPVSLSSHTSCKAIIVFDFALFGSVFVTLFVIMDPPGITPIFLALTSGRPVRTQRRMAWQATAVAFAVIAVFGLCGQQILDYLHVSVPALMVAGGLLLLLIALDLLTTGCGRRNARSKLRPGSTVSARRRRASVPARRSGR